MTFSELLQAAREELSDTAGTSERDFALTRSMALRYFNEAEAEACRRSRLLIDMDTEEICSITVTAGQAVYNRDERIVKILSARLSGRATPLARMFRSDMADGWQDHTGTVIGWLNDYATNKIRLYRKPEASGILSLEVQRTQLAAMANDTDRPEIPLRYHYGLINYVVGKIRGNDDTEMYDPRKAALAMAEFDKEFGVKRSAQNEAYELSQPISEDE